MLCTQVEPYLGVGTWGREPGACAPPSFQKLLHKLLVTLCVVTKCAQKIFPTPLPYCILGIDQRNLIRSVHQTIFHQEVHEVSVATMYTYVRVSLECMY